MAPRPSAIPETSEKMDEVVPTPVDTASLEQLPSSPADKTPTVDEVSELYNETIQTCHYIFYHQKEIIGEKCPVGSGRDSEPAASQVKFSFSFSKYYFELSRMNVSRTKLRRLPLLRCWRPLKSSARSLRIQS